MYKKFTKKPGFQKRLRFLMRMSLIYIILNGICLQILMASHANSQDLESIVVNVEMHSESLVDLFRKIEHQTNLKFVYGQFVTKEQRTISFPAGDRSVKSTLDIALQGTSLKYLQKSGNVVIYPGPAPVVQRQVVPVVPILGMLDRFVAENNVSGTVTDENGEPLIGVNIQVKGTNQGTATDLDGSFTLENVDPNAILIISYIGYLTQEIGLTGRTILDIRMVSDVQTLDELIVIGYGTVKKSDLTGSVTRIDGDDFKTFSTVQVTDMLAGTVAGFSSTQGTTAAGGGSMEIRGPNSLSAGTNPLIVLDGVVFHGSLREINPFDIETIDILKDASSAAVYGSSAATGVILITTTKGQSGKPTISFTSKLGITRNNNELRGLGPEEYLKFREDYLRQVSPNLDFNYFSNPNNLQGSMSVDQWLALSSSPQSDPIAEWMSRLRLFPEEQVNYLAGRTMDMYDEVFQNGIRQNYDLSVSGGTDNAKYYWSLGYINNEGIRTGDQYSSIRSRLNIDFKVAEWLSIGLNSHFSDRDESAVPASLSFWANSPYGEMFDAEGNLKRLPHGHTDNPLLAYYRTDLLNKTNSLFANMYAEVKLPFGIKFKTSFQPKYTATKYNTFTNISTRLGGFPNETPSGERRDFSSLDWMLDNLLTWNKSFGLHNFDITLLANVEENQSWSSIQSNQNFQPNQQLSFHGLQYGDGSSIDNNDIRSTGDALMGRINYSFNSKYLFTASVRRDGYSAFGAEYPRATFPAVAVAWVISEEDFYSSSLINRLKMRFSWGANGNRNIGVYSALANVNSLLWYDGTSNRIGVEVTTLSNRGLKWERTESSNIGLDIGLLNYRINLTLDAYVMTTTDLLLRRVLPRATGFQSIVTNLGQLDNNGFEFTLNSVNISKSNFEWSSDLVFSLNRNKIRKLFGDTGTYTLLGEEKSGELPDFTNGWFPGQDIDVVWNYDIIGIWQSNEAEEARKYNMNPGDYKGIDVNGDNKFIDLDDKQFIGYERPRFLLGLRNDFAFLKNFTASVFIRADLGHIGSYIVNPPGQADRANKSNGPDPYWTVDKPNDEFPRLNHYTAAYGGGLGIYKPRSFVRIQDLSLAYNLPTQVVNQVNIKNLQIFCTVRNLATFTKWPGWDPESGLSPMPSTYTAGLHLSL